MAAPTKHSDCLITPGNRKVHHSFSTSSFTEIGKGDVRNRTPQSPTVTMKWPGETSTDISVPAISEVSGETTAAPIAIPVSVRVSAQKLKKLAPSNTFNTHYRTISRSMNDLGNIFSRGRSPPSRDISPLRTSSAIAAIDNRRKAAFESPHGKNLEAASVPSISVMQHGETETYVHVIREGWLNIIDSEIKTITSLRDSCKLHYAMIIAGQMLLYKSPSSFQIKAFEFDAAPPIPPRPQTAPAITSPTFLVSSLRHKSTSRHPELILRDDGTVNGGTVEALCHELVFTNDPMYVYWSARSLSGWTSLETALSVLIELSALQDSSLRIGEILKIVTVATPGLLLESKCYNCARLLAEKGIGHHNQELAKSSRKAIESVRAHLQQTLGMPRIDDGMSDVVEIEAYKF